MVKVEVVWERILERVVKCHVRTRVLALGPGIAALELQSMAQILGDPRLQPVIPPVIVPKPSAHTADQGIQFPDGSGGEQITSRRQCRHLVVDVVWQVWEMNAPRSDISWGHGQVGSE